MLKGSMGFLMVVMVDIMLMVFFNDCNGYGKEFFWNSCFTWGLHISMCV